jgi:hypothetical protein
MSNPALFYDSPRGLETTYRLDTCELVACLGARCSSRGWIQIEFPIHVSLSPHCEHRPRRTICSLENSLRTLETTHDLLLRKILDVNEIHSIFEYSSSPSMLLMTYVHEDRSSSGFSNFDQPRSLARAM